MDSKAFACLTEQVISRWIDSEAKGRGISQWTASVLTRVEAGNSPGGQSTRRGILVRPSVKKDKSAQLLMGLIL